MMPLALPSQSERLSLLTEARGALNFAHELLDSPSVSTTDVSRAFLDLAAHAQALAWLSVTEVAECGAQQKALRGVSVPVRRRRLEQPTG